MTYWQVASGDRGRNYSDLFLKYGIMCVGGKNQIRTIQKVEEGDKVLLKIKKKEILAAGVVQKSDESVYHEDEKWLGDFDGWNLKAYTNVDWYLCPKRLKHRTRGLKQGTLFRSKNPEAQGMIDTIIKNGRRNKPEKKPKKYLNSIYPIGDEEIMKFLVTEGFRPGSAEELTSTFNRIRLLANFYYEKCDWSTIREHETRTFLIMPLLLALGWSEQQLKVEYYIPGGKIDIAAFSKPFFGRGDKPRCEMILESKGFENGLDGVEEQAKIYAEKLPECRKIVVTNGFCYKIFKRAGGEFSKTPFAYMNLRKPMNRHPLYPKSAGALDVFRALLP